MYREHEQVIISSFYCVFLKNITNRVQHENELNVHHKTQNDYKMTKWQPLKLWKTPLSIQQTQMWVVDFQRQCAVHEFGKAYLLYALQHHCSLVFYKDYFPILFIWSTEFFFFFLKQTMSHFADYSLLQSLCSFKMVSKSFGCSKVLSNILLVLVALLLFHLRHFILQLHDGTLDFIVLTDKRHPAVKTQARNMGVNELNTTSSETSWTYTHIYWLGLKFSQFGSSSQLIVFALPVQVLYFLSNRKTETHSWVGTKL